MQERTGQYRKKEDNTGKNRTIQEKNRTVQEKTGQYRKRTGQCRKKQDNTGKNMTKQERTGQTGRTCYMVVG